MEFDEETGEPSAEVERATGSCDPFNFSQIESDDYRFRLDQAIDALPMMQRRIIEMLRKGIPIDSIDANAVTIAKSLGKSEKTIRIHRDKAFASLRATLTVGEN
jgi:DNA-directed RNA polymerase specialized sigma24 family protein